MPKKKTEEKQIIAEDESAPKKKSPFDYIKGICSVDKDDLMETEQDEKDYSSFVVNRGLSLYSDTVLIANEMNRYHELPTKLKYHFLLYAVRPKKRWSKWPKKEKDENVEFIMEVFGYNRKKAIEACQILTKEQLDKIRASRETGGKM